MRPNSHFPWATWRLPAFTILVAVLLFAGVFLSVRLMADGILRLQKSWNGFQNVESLKLGVSRADSLSMQYAKMLQRLKGLGEGLPEGTESSQVLEILVNEAKACSLSIGRMEAMQERVFPTYREFAYSISGNGEFPHFQKYFKALESHGLVMRWHRIVWKAPILHKSQVTAEWDVSVFAASASNSANMQSKP